MQMDVREEQRLAIELHVMGHAHIADVAAGARDSDGLRHRLLGANALEDGISANALRELLDAFDAVVAALRDHVCGAERAGERLTRRVAITSDSASMLGIMSASGTSRVATRVPSANGTRSRGAWAPATGSRRWHEVWDPRWQWGRCCRTRRTIQSRTARA